MGLFRFVCVVGTAAALTGIAGCRSAGDLLGFEEAKGVSNTVWNTPLEDVDPPKEGRNSIYVQYRDMSGNSIELRDQIREHIRSRGYTLSKDPDTADYRLTATLRFFGRNPQNDGGRSQAMALGAIVGGASGVAAYEVAESVNASPIQRVGVGAGTGVVTGIAAANYSTSREWDMIIDVVIAQRVEGGVQTTISTDKRNSLSTGAGMSTGGGQTSGAQQDSTRRGQDMVQNKTHLLFPGRLTAWSTRWTMERDEAQQELVPRITSALCNAVPPAD